jgi:DNA-binding SARP family transcriptional activator
MAEITATLIGKFNIQQEGLDLTGIEQRRVRELCCYLLLFHVYPHSRDFLCETLWSDQSAARSKNVTSYALTPSVCHAAGNTFNWIDAAERQ